MKLVTMRDTPEGKTGDLIKMVLERAPQGMGVAEMRKRMRVLDALEQVDGALALEDADHATLVGAVNGFVFGATSRTLMQMVDDILEAKDAPATQPAAS